MIDLQSLLCYRNKSTMKNQFYPLFCGLLLFLFLTSPFKFFAQTSLISNLHFAASSGSNFSAEENLSNFVLIYSNRLDTFATWHDNDFPNNVLLKPTGVLENKNNKLIEVGHFAFCKMRHVSYSNHRLNTEMNEIIVGC